MSGQLSVVALAIQTTIAVIAIVVGTWGTSYVPALRPGDSDEERATRAAVIKRGAVTCLVVGWILSASVLWAVISMRP
ncbi:hypothetical protein ACW14X_28825 [Nocardioides sp. YJ-D4]